MILQFLVWYYVFLFSVVFHESAHAWASHKLGDDTGYEGGQVSLNPLPHIRQEPFGTVVVPIITFIVSGWMMGWASTPYDMRWALNYPKKSALMSLAGPLANLLIVICSGVLIRLGVLFHVFESPNFMNFTKIVISTENGFFTGAALVLSIFFSLNLLLFAFNMLPLSPMDGSGLIPFFLEEEAAQKYLVFISNPNMSIIGIIIAWNIFRYIFPPVHALFVNILYFGIASY